MNALSFLGLPSWIILLVVFLAGAGSGGGAARIYYTGEIAKMELAQAKANKKSDDVVVVKREESKDSAVAASSADASAQEKIIYRTVTLKEKVNVYVKDTSTCITIGLVRLLDAAALGINNPDTLSLAPGEFNETCAAIGSNALANSVVGNYGLARQNSQQLNDLEDEMRRQKAIIER